VVAGQAVQVKPNSGMVFKFGSKPGLLIRTPDGELRAFSAVCTHLDCTVQYKSDTSQIWCACHNGFYDLSGNVVSGPPPRPLESLVVNQRGDDVVVSRA
jgi:Rieske Fe-S protein